MRKLYKVNVTRSSYNSDIDTISVVASSADRAVIEATKYKRSRGTYWSGEVRDVEYVQDIHRVQK